MSKNVSSLLKHLIQFGNTGNTGSVEAVLRETLQPGTSASFGSVDASVIQKVNRQAIKVLKSSDNNEVRAATWHCLYVLTDSTMNMKNKEFLQSLQDPQLLQCAVRSSISTYSREATSCMQFLSAFTHKSGTRSGCVLANGDLVDALLSRLDRPVVTAAMDLDVLQHNSLTNSLHIVDNILEACISLEVLLKRDLFARVQNMLSLVCSFCVPTAAIKEAITKVYKAKDCHSPQYVKLLICCLNSKCNLYLAISPSRRHPLDDPQSEESYGSDYYEGLMDHGAGDTAYCMYYLFDHHDREVRFLVRRLAMLYFAHVNMLEYGINIATVLAMTNPDVPSVPSFGKKLVEFIRNPELRVQGEAESVAFMLDTSTLLHPCVRDFITEELGEKGAFCAHPECGRSSLQPRLLKKCVQCMSVWYCGREHQVAHWKEHKAECKQRAAALAAEKVIDTI